MNEELADMQRADEKMHGRSEKGSWEDTFSRKWALREGQPNLLAVDASLDSPFLDSTP